MNFFDYRNFFKSLKKYELNTFNVKKYRIKKTKLFALDHIGNYPHIKVIVFDI